MSSAFDSEDLSVEILFHDFYVVPDYQREYVWEEREVSKLLDDLLQEFSQVEPGIAKSYFVGTIVASGSNEHRTYNLVDGQQRLTTLFVFFCAVRDLLDDAQEDTELLDGQLLGARPDADGNPTRHHRVELQYEDSQQLLESFAAPRSQVDVDEIPAATRSAKNLKRAYATIRSFLKTEFGSDIGQLRRFWLFVTNDVKIIRVRTHSVSRALWIFETINKRGRVFRNSTDLLKNFVCSRAPRPPCLRASSSAGSALSDTLYASGERPDAVHAALPLWPITQRTALRADEVYGAGSSKHKGQGGLDFAERPVEFTDELMGAANAYTSFLAWRHPDGQRVALACGTLRHLGRAARQHLVPMLAARSQGVASPRIARPRDSSACIFVYLLTGQQTNRFEKDFLDWTLLVRKRRTARGDRSDASGAGGARAQTVRPEFRRDLGHEHAPVPAPVCPGEAEPRDGIPFSPRAPDGAGLGSVLSAAEHVVAADVYSRQAIATRVEKSPTRER